MTKIIISMGTNCGQESHMNQACSLLEGSFPGIVFSESLWTEPIGIESSSMFLNALAVAHTELSEQEVQQRLKDVEHLCGRRPEDKKIGIVHMDIDLLLYGDKQLHKDDWKRQYVVLLMQKSLFSGK